MSRRLLPTMWIGVVVAMLLGALALMVLPTRTWVQQRSEAAASERELAEVEARNAELQTRIAVLDTPMEIERIAREEYGMAKPGEQVFAVLPGPVPTELPALWPFTLLAPLVPPPG